MVNGQVGEDGVEARGTKDATGRHTVSSQVGGMRRFCHRR